MASLEWLTSAASSICLRSTSSRRSPLLKYSTSRAANRTEAAITSPPINQGELWLSEATKPAVGWAVMTQVRP